MNKLPADYLLYTAIAAIQSSIETKKHDLTVIKGTDESFRSFTNVTSFDKKKIREDFTDIEAQSKKPGMIQILP
jgi:hypothetical protein